MNGILELKNSVFLFVFFSVLLCISCKEKSNQKVSSAAPDYKTNIRFATKTDGYVEKSSFVRLKTDKTEITSTQFQMEGPAWENENVAFRNYFDARNGMDIFGKRNARMVLDSVGIDEDYHALQNWGMDILKVGNSLGAGAIALILNDSIYRMGVGAEGSFKVIEETPLSSSLEFNFKDWKVQDRTYNVSHIINIKAGTHYYEGTIEIEGLKGDELLATGIVDHGVGASTVAMNSFITLFTHGNQDVENKALGMAIAMESGSFYKMESADNYIGNVDNTHLILSKKNGVKYKFFAGWRMQDKGFETKEYFDKVIRGELD